MKIFTFVSDDPDLPNLVRTEEDKSKTALGKSCAVARIWCAFTGVGGGAVMGWSPVIFMGSSAEDARAKAQAGWDTMVAAEAAKTKPRAKPKAKAAPEPVEEEEEAIG